MNEMNALKMTCDLRRQKIFERKKYFNPVLLCCSMFPTIEPQQQNGSRLQHFDINAMLCSCVHYGIRIVGERIFGISSQTPLVGGFGCLDLVLYGIREQAGAASL